MQFIETYLIYHHSYHCHILELFSSVTSSIINNIYFLQRNPFVILSLIRINVKNATLINCICSVCLFISGLCLVYTPDWMHKENQACTLYFEMQRKMSKMHVYGLTWKIFHCKIFFNLTPLFCTFNPCILYLLHAWF